MKNKGLLWTFVILLAIMTLYSLSFGIVTNKFEKQAEQWAISAVNDSLMQPGWTDYQVDSAVAAQKRMYLRDSSEKKVYPVLGLTYGEVKENELNLGLDLQGGMSVTLEVSVPDLIIALSDYNTNEQFRKAIEDAKEAQKSSTSDFLTLFEEAWKAGNNSGTSLYRIFSFNVEAKSLFPPNASDDEMMDILRREAETAINNTENIIRKRIDQFGIAQPTVQKQSFSGRILVELPGVDDRERVRTQLKSTANLEFWDTYFSSEIVGKFQSINDALGRRMHPELFTNDSTATDSTAVAEELPKDTTNAETAIDTLNDGIDTSGIDTGDKPGEAPETTEVSREDRLKNPLFNKMQPYLDRYSQGEGCRVGFAKVSDTVEVNRLLRSPEAKAVLPPDLRLLWSAKPVSNTVALYAIKDPSMKGKAPLDGSCIVNATRDFDITNEVIVSMTMSGDVGAPIWKKMTEKNAADNHRAIAIVMDNLVYSSPSVNSVIPNGRSQISLGAGNSVEKQIEEADDLSSLLKAGSLPAPARIIDEVTVGPSLGEMNIRSGMFSFIGAFIIVLLFMMWYYAGAGFIACIALVANLFFLIGALISMHASLTLPGIAGIVLTMGMAVDANVIINERIKEEMRHGKGLVAAVKDGYNMAYSSIIDGNLTTFLTGLVLLVVGSGPIRGFAVTLLIGIVTSLFTSIFITRLVIFRRLEKKKNVTFWNKTNKGWFTTNNFDFVGKRKRFYLISIVVIGAGLISVFTRGFNLGVDFIGGNSFRVDFVEKMEPDVVRQNLANVFVENGTPAELIVQSVENKGTAFKITTDYLVNSKEADSEVKVLEKLKEGLDKTGGAYELGSSFKVDATMSDDFRKESVWATILALIIIGIYILLRFKKMKYAIGATLALLHDVLVTIAMFSLLNGLVPFTLEVNQIFIAALLTIAGYSINDTVVIFDRLREYLTTHRSVSEEVTINNALNSTLGRTVNTALTVLLTLLVMFFFGSDEIRGFSFALIVGVVAGTYSSIFIATPVVIDFGRYKRKVQKEQAKKVAAATT